MNDFEAHRYFHEREVPEKAITVKQPWAWAIGRGKDFENRDWDRHPHRNYRGPIAIHAGVDLKRRDYIWAADFIERVLGERPPHPLDLPRGGIVAIAEITAYTPKRFETLSRWRIGHCGGLNLIGTRPVEFTAAIGQQGIFKWSPLVDSVPRPPLLWMKDFEDG